MHPGLDDFHRDGTTDDLATKTENVAVIVLAGQLGAERILTDDGKDAAQLVGDHRAAVAHAIDKDTALTLPPGDRFRRRLDEVREITTLLIVSTKILNLVPFAFEIFLDGLFQGRTSVIVCHSDFHDDVLLLCHAQKTVHSSLYSFEHNCTIFTPIVLYLAEIAQSGSSGKRRFLRRQAVS